MNNTQLIKQVEETYKKPIGEVLAELTTRYRTIQELATALGVGVGTARYWLMSHGWRKEQILVKSGMTVEIKTSEGGDHATFHV